MTTDPTPGDARPAVFSTSAGADMWRRGAAERAQYLGPATGLMLDLAGIGPGSRVLDVAAGTGEQSILAAQRVSPGGSVLATDISAQMLEVAAESAREAGMSNVETQVADAQSLDLAADSFDAVISRLGLMLLPAIPTALRSILGVLHPGGKFAAVVWGSAENNGLIITASMIARRYPSLPPRTVGDAQLFGLGEADALADALKGAGFRDVTVQREPANRPFASVDQAARELLTTMPFLSQAPTRLSPAELDGLISDLEDALRKFEGPEGCVGPGEVVVGVGTK